MVFDFSFLERFYFSQPTLDSLKEPIIGTFFDGWSIIHFFSGWLIAIFFKNLKQSQVILLLVAYEVFELILLQQGLTTPETTINIIADIFFGWLGWRLYRR